MLSLQSLNSEESFALFRLRKKVGVQYPPTQATMSEDYGPAFKLPGHVRNPCCVCGVLTISRISGTWDGPNRFGAEYVTLAPHAELVTLVLASGTNMSCCCKFMRSRMIAC